MKCCWYLGSIWSRQRMHFSYLLNLQIIFTSPLPRILFIIKFFLVLVRYDFPRNTHMLRRPNIAPHLARPHKRSQFHFKWCSFNSLFTKLRPDKYDYGRLDRNSGWVLLQVHVYFCTKWRINKIPLCECWTEHKKQVTAGFGRNPFGLEIYAPFTFTNDRRPTGSTIHVAYHYFPLRSCLMCFRTEILSYCAHHFTLTVNSFKNCWLSGSNATFVVIFPAFWHSSSRFQCFILIFRRR